MRSEDGKSLKVKDLETEALRELDQEDKQVIKEEIKERLREIRQTRKILKKLESKYQQFLEADPDELL